MGIIIIIEKYLIHYISYISTLAIICLLLPLVIGGCYILVSTFETWYRSCLNNAAGLKPAQIKSPNRNNNYFQNKAEVI